MLTLLAKITAKYHAFQIEIVFPIRCAFQSELWTAIVTVKRHFEIGTNWWIFGCSLEVRVLTNCTNLSILKLYSTNFWLTCLTCMVRRNNAQQYVFIFIYSVLYLKRCITPALHQTRLLQPALYCRAKSYTETICTAFHCTALYCAVLPVTSLHCTSLHCTAVKCTIQHWLFFTVQCTIHLTLHSFSLKLCSATINLKT